MKSKILFIVIALTAIAVVTADGRDLRHEPGEQVNTAEALLLPGATEGHVGLSLDGTQQDQQLENPRERKQHSTMCKRKLRGRCVRRRKPCPGHLPSQMSPGSPYCSKFHRCCAPASCPEDEGFFTVPDSGNQCFKFLPNYQRREQAKISCNSEGLILAKPVNPAAVRLFVKETVPGHADGATYWLGARGNGSTFIWDHDGTALSNNDSSWVSGEPCYTDYADYTYCYTGSCDCLVMSFYLSNNPYTTNSCGQTNIKGLCQYLPTVKPTTSTNTSAPGGCPSPWFRMGSQCFLYVSDPSERRGWSSARTWCQEQDPEVDLAQPADIKGLADYLVDKCLGASYFWLGGSDLAEEGEWVWLNGSAITQGWGTMRPLGGADYPNYNCLYIRPGSGASSLSNKPCDGIYDFVCERPLV